MLFIRKTHPPPDLLDFINTERRRGVFNPAYSDLQTDNPTNPYYRAYTQLREQLYAEQRGLCCYCMKVISVRNSNVEHFLPQSAFPEGEVDYYNLYLACRYSQGLPKDRQHCDIRKANALIGKFIGYGSPTVQRCEDLIKYTPDGYILPANTPFKSLEDAQKNYLRLGPNDKAILVTIEILNLNTRDLRKEREHFIDDLIREIMKSPTDTTKLEAMRREYEEDFSKKFAGVALYFIKQRLGTLLK
ncbi:MAG TPA: retron system putative HNH endonuclease [Pyrinomonadaceae bacterium]|jgi:uncharacterized protein (TIGR02646 family)